MRIFTLTMAPLGATVFVACTGEVFGGRGGVEPSAWANPTGPGPAAPAPTVGSGAPSTFSLHLEANLRPRLRLKSNVEIYNAIQEVLGVAPSNPKALPNERIQLATGFFNDSTGHQMGEGLFYDVQSLAVEMVKVTTDAKLMQFCTTKVATDATCGRQTAVGFAKAFLGREPSQEEEVALLNVHTKTVAAGGSKQALQGIVEAILQLPSFLYRSELGNPAVRSVNSPLTPFEVAWALASFLWESPPDAELLAAASTGSLSDVGEVERQARRMLASAKARPAFGRFALQWLGIRDIELNKKDLSAFPGYSVSVARSMTEETTQYAAASVFDDDSTLQTLLTGRTSYLDKTLTDFYGFGSSRGAQFEKTSLPSLKAGILTHGSFNVAHSGELDTSPIKRGAFVRMRLLCDELAAPPPDAPTSVDPPASGQSIQDVFNQHKRAECSGCHRLMNPIGFGFENVDSVGKTRTTYNNLTIDSSGEIVSQKTGEKYPYAAGTGLYETLASMSETSDCFALRLYQFALGRQAGQQDNDALTILAAQFGNDKRITELMVRIATNPQFLTRNTL